MKRQSSILFLGVLLGFTSYAAAVSYDIQRTDGRPNSVPVVQGRSYNYNVTPNPAGSVFDFIRIVGSQFVVTAPPANRTPTPGLFRPNSTGVLPITVRYDAPLTNIQLSAINDGDDTIFGSITVQTERYPQSFRITPNTPSFQAGVQNTIQIIAVDQPNGNGNWVQGFEDGIQIDAVQASATQQRESSTFAGSVFVAGNGQATVPITVNTADINNRLFLQVTLTGNQYVDPSGNPIPAATFQSAQLTLIPGPYQKLIQLFEGERLVPGFGKNSTNIVTQVSNKEIPIVQVYPVDAFYNPIYNGPARTIRFTSSDNRDPNPLRPDEVMNSAPLTIQNSSLNPIVFQGNGPRTVTALEVGQPNTEWDVSTVPVAPGAANTYRFLDGPNGNPTANPVPATVTTDDTIDLYIEALDGQSPPQRLTTLTACTTTGMALGLQVNPPNGEERFIWVDTNPLDDPTTSDVCFQNGVAHAVLNVTKRSSVARLTFRDAFNRSVTTNNFAINVGGTRRVLFTIVGKDGQFIGEQFAEGTYPGNTGTIPAITAGDTMVVEARVTDRRFNRAPESANTNKELQIQSIFPVSFVDAPPSAVFDFQGEMSVRLGNELRVKFRTAGSAVRFQGASTIGAGLYFSSPVRVLSGPYAKLALTAPGEILRPGTNIPAQLATGKEGNPNTQGAGMEFYPTYAFVTDQYFNPLTQVPAGGYPDVIFSANPTGANAKLRITGSQTTVPLGQHFQLNSSTTDISTTLSLAATLTVADPDASANANTTIPIGAGILHHFSFTLANNNPKDAGTPFDVTIQARDGFDNPVKAAVTVNLASNLGPLTVMPTTVTLDSNGTYSGSIVVKAADPALSVIMTQGSITSTSSPFLVRNQVFSRLLLLGPNEIQLPGRDDIGGKNTSNASTTAGVSSSMTIVACDAYFNRVPTAPNLSVQLTSNHFAKFESALQSQTPYVGNVTLSAGIATDKVILLEANVPHTVTATLQGGPVVPPATSTFTATPAAYSKILTLLNGEVFVPGDVENGGKNPNITATPAKVSIPYSITLIATDAFYNKVSKSDGDTAFLTDPSVQLILVPNNQVKGGPTPNNFVNGVSSRSVVFLQATLPGQTFAIRAKDQAPIPTTRPEIFGEVYNVTVLPGPIYVVKVLSTPVRAGEPFSVRVTLEENNQIVTNSPPLRLFLSASKPGQLNTSAAGSFTVDDTSTKDVVLENGDKTFTLEYRHVENISVKVTDEFGRVGNSSAVTVVPVALSYRVSVPTAAVVGPPLDFPIHIELIEKNQNTKVLVSDYNHDVSITALLEDLSVAQGSASVKTRLLINNGEALNIPFSYSKAENIQLLIADKSNTVGATPARSALILMKPANYVKILALESSAQSLRSGIVNDPTGCKVGPATVTVKRGVNQNYMVYAVDQFCNITDTTGGQILYTSDDPSIGPNNPTANGTPFTLGQQATTMRFNVTGNKFLKVTEGAYTDTINLFVDGATYIITIPNQSNLIAAQPFTMQIELRDTSGNLVPSGASISIAALMPGTNTPAHGQLSSVQTNLSGGQQTIQETFSLAEDITLQISDADGNIGTLGPLHILPSQVAYSIVLSSGTEIEAGTYFNIGVTMVDATTQQRVYNVNRRLDLKWFENIRGQQVTGSFLPTTLDLTAGVGVINSARYDLVGPLYVQLIDPTDPLRDAPPFPSVQKPNGYNSATINIHPGSIANLSGIQDFSMLANETRDFTLTGTDALNNVSANQNIELTFISETDFGKILMNGEFPQLVARTNSLGQLTVRFQPTIDANGPAQLRISDRDHPDRLNTIINIQILGVGSRPAGALELGGDHIPVGSPFPLEITAVPGPGGTVRTFYTIDGGSQQTYDPNQGVTGLNETKSYTIEYFSDVCYPGVDPTCASAIRESATHVQQVTTYRLDESISSYPNPFNPKGPAGENFITIQYPLAQASSVEIDIYDLMGQKVWHKDINAGEQGGQAREDNRVFWFGANDDGTVVANGGYITTVKVGATGQRMKTKILVVK